MSQSRRIAVLPRQETESELRALIDSIPDFAIYRLDPTGIIQSWSEGSEHTQGYSAREVIGRPLSLFYTPEDRAAGMPERALKIAAEAGVYRGEGWRVRKNGTRFMASVMIARMLDPDGNIVGFSKVAHDETRNYAISRERDAALAEVAQAKHEAAIGRMAAGAAHDFNNLLQTIVGNAELLQAMLPCNLRALARLDLILEASSHAANLTKGLRKRRQQSEVPTLLDTERSLFDTVGLVEHLSRSAGIYVQKPRIQSPVPNLMVDRAAFLSAMLNLAVNARDAMPSGGTLAIGARAGQDAGVPLVIITVEDTGVGMTEELRLKLADPNNRRHGLDLSTKSEGGGLGLQQVYDFARRAGGRVEIASTLGQGTRVTLYLPAASKAGPIPEPLGDPEDSLVRSLGRSLTVLVVEDDKGVAAVSADTLRDLGYRVEVAYSAQEALSILSSHRRVDLIVSDIIMPPGQNGVDMAYSIRDAYPDMPIILTTGHSPDSIRPHTFPLLPKPYSRQELSQWVASALAAVSSIMGGALG